MPRLALTAALVLMLPVCQPGSLTLHVQSAGGTCEVYKAAVSGGSSLWQNCRVE